MTTSQRHDLLWIMLAWVISLVGVLSTIAAFTPHYLIPVAFGWCGGWASCMLYALARRR